MKLPRLSVPGRSRLSGPSRSSLPAGALDGLAAAVLLLGAGALAGVAFLGDDGDDRVTSAAASSTTTLFARSTTTFPFVPDTTSTTVVAAPTTTTRPAAVTTPTVPPTTRPATTTTRPATTTTRAPTATTAAPPTGICGSGKATVTFAPKDLVTDALSSSLTPQATVDNQVSAPIQVDELVMEIVYPGDDVRTARFATAGTVINPGTSASFTAERITTTKRYESVRITRFTYFTQGQPTTCRVTAP